MRSTSAASRNPRALKPAGFGLSVAPGGDETAYAVSFQRQTDELELQNDPGIGR